MLKLAEVFDEYPNPFYIVKPVGEEYQLTDFEYVYANQAFSQFVGKKQEELMGHRFQECFDVEAERRWMDLFCEVAKNDKKHTYVEDVSRIIQKRMYTEAFHIEPDLCACIIHDAGDADEKLSSTVNRELQYQAKRDFLTGFYNRYSLKDLHSTIVQKEKIGITYLDINDLKITNDTLGHEAGDELILLISNMIRSYYEDSMVFRVGGDEFVIVTIGQDEQEFMEMSVRSRQVFEERDLASIGYQFYPRVENLKKCIAQCDALMYERKREIKK